MNSTYLQTYNDRGSYELHMMNRIKDTNKNKHSINRQNKYLTTDTYFYHLWSTFHYCIFLSHSNLSTSITRFIPHPLMFSSSHANIKPYPLPSMSALNHLLAWQWESGSDRSCSCEPDGAAWVGKRIGCGRDRLPLIRRGKYPVEP